MRYKDRDTLVSSLRELADFIETKGLELPMDNYDVGFRLTIFVYQREDVSAKDQMARAARAFGTAEKNWTSDYLDLGRKFGCLTLEFSASRNSVCTRREVGTKVHPEKIEVIPARTETLYEYDCDPLLA